MNFTPAGLPKLSPKERAVYSCLVILCYLALLGASVFAGLGVAFLSGLVTAYYHLTVGGDWVCLVSGIALAGTGAIWLIGDHRSNFIMRSALAGVEYITRKKP